MKTHKFARKPFYVDAVRVSEANIEEVAQWCNGKVMENEDGQRYVKVTVLRPLNDRQTEAFIGDWVLYAGTGFKVYTTKAFDKAFEKVKTLTKAQADAAGIKVPHEPSQKPHRVGAVGRALRDAQAKKAPVPTPPKNKPVAVENAELRGVTTIKEIKTEPDLNFEMPTLAPSFSNIVEDRESGRELTEAEKDANAQAAIESVLKEG